MDRDEDNYPWHARSEAEDDIKADCPALKYLVFSEQSDRLFLVGRNLMEIGEPGEFKEETVGFDVHEIIINKDSDTGGELRYMDGTLNGMAFFIGSGANCGSVIEDPGAVGLLPNSIYYTDPIEVRTPSYWNLCGGHHLLVFDYAANQNVSHCPCHLPGFDVPPKPDMLEHEPVPIPLWFTPPPSI